MKQFLRYTLTLVAILIATTPAWAQAQNLQYQWVTRFDNTITFDDTNLEKITNGTYVEHVKFSITDVSYYHDNKLIGDDVDRLDYTTYKDANEHQSTWSWEVEQNTQNQYRVTVTDIKCQVRGKNSDDNQPAYAWFNNNSKVDCKTKSGDEGGSQEVGISNANGLGNSVIFKRQGSYKKSSISNWVEDYVTFTLHNIRYTCKVEQQVPLFQYKAIALTNNSEYGSAYSSWTSFANATNSESSHSAYNKDILSASNGLGQKVYFKAVPKAGYNFVGWKESLDATTYKSYEEEYSFDFTSTSNDKNAPTTITLYAIFEAQKDPRFTIQSTASAEVGDIFDSNFSFDDVANTPVDYQLDKTKDFYYEITHTPDNTTKADSPDPTKVVEYNSTTNKITALNSGTAIIKFTHKSTDVYTSKVASCTITVNKNTSYFTLNFADEYFVDDQIAKRTFLVSPTNTEVAISVSDSEGYFTYSNDVLKASGNQLPANEAQTTITVTQPENYKWTSYTLNKTVTVKKHTTDFAWQLQDSYFVGEEDASIFTKSDNNLASTITSSDPSVIEVVDNKLVMRKAGSAVITVSQATDRKWTDFSYTKTVNVVKRDLEAAIHQSSAVWNELISDPFTVSFKHPITGAVTTLTDYTVTQTEDSKLIAEYKSNNIQTYYTNGTVDFLITRPEDDNYNTFSQTLTLNVNQSTENCPILEDNNERSWSTINNSGTYTIPSGRPDSLFFQAKRTAILGISNTSNFYAEYSTDNSNWTRAMTIDLGSTDTWYNLKCDIPETAKYIRFVTYTGATGNKQIRNVRVTRKEEINPSIVEGGTLKLPTVAFGKPSSNTFTLDWSTCTDIKISCDNSKFTISDENGTPITDITTNDGTQVLTVSCNTSEIGIYNGIITIYNQSRKVSFNVTDTVNDKWTPVMTGEESYSKKVGNTWTTNFTFKNTETATPSADKNAPFYFEIDHKSFVNTDRLTRNPNHLDEVISYNPDTYEITAHNAGTAILTFVQQENDSYYYSARSCTITIDKNNPTFTWKEPVYFNQTISDYFTTNNNPNENEYATEVSITQESSDPDVAIIYFNQEDDTDKYTLDLTTYYKETSPESSTQVTVYQEENWYWNAKEDTHTITPKNKNNHVSNTPITEANLNDFKIEYQDPWNNPWTDGGIHFGEPNIGNGGGGWNWNDKYIIVEFTGVPDSLFFTTATTGSAGMDNPLDAGDNATNNKFFYVSAGTSKDNLNEIWSSTSQTNTYKEKLDPSVRFLKLCYTGNLEGWFKNVRITELNQFEFIPDALDFGEVKITDNTSKTLTTKFHYANAGHNIKVELDRSSFADEAAYELAKKYITINPAAINDIGGENIGEREIQITLHSDDKTPYIIPEGAKIKIWDEANRHDYLSISGLIEPSEQEIYWSAYFQLEEPIAIPLETGDVKNAATASSNLPITYKTDNPEVIQISDDKSYFTPIAVGDATITAIQDGNQVYDRVESSKKITVTQKMVQIISWPVDFTDLILVENPDPIPLTAATYLLDLVNNRPVFSQEQTDKIEYSVENEEVVKIVDGQLVIVGLGSTTITAAINESEDSHYESTSTTLPVIVREPAVGCEDMLLLDQPNEVEIFTDGMNTNEIVKNAMAIDRTLGIPGRVEFQHKGEAWKLFGSVSFYAGAIKVQQSTDGGNTWSDVPNTSVTPTQSVYNTSVATLDRNATHIRFVRPSGGQGYHYYKDVKVYPAQYLESATTSINYENINVGGTYTKKINISYSNIKSPIYYIASSSDITVSPKTFGECGKFGTQELTITWKPSTNIGQQTVTFRDSLSEISDLTINLTANIDRRKQEILWENRPEVILSHTGIDNRPIYTIDANSKAPTTLKIEYTVVEGTENAYFSDDMFFILNEGEITIKAANDGNEEYAAIEEVYNLTLQGVPPTFIGGTDNQLWNNENNWKNKLMPSDEYSIANITAPVEINNLLVDINNVRVADNASIHITSTGGLTVGEGGVQCVTTDGSAIIIDNLHSGAGFFRISPDCEDELPRITMRYQTKSTLDNGANKNAEWQYIGAPGEDASVHVDYNTWLYRLDESQADWVLMPQLNNHTLDPFQGYALTQYGQPTYEWNAQMINRNCTIPLTYHFDGRKGQNLIANSYTAPIDVTQMTSEDFQMIDGQSEYYDITQTLYLYNSGSWNAWHTQDSLGTGISSDGDNTTPGQYYAIPVLAVAKGYIPEKPTIAPMQGIYVRVRAKKTGGDTHVGNIIFNYDSIVMGEGHDMHRPMRAPQTTDQNTSDDLFRRVRIVANSSNSGSDRLYIIQAHNTTRNYDNGYDAPNQATQGIVNIYTYESGGKMEVSCANNIDSTYIGFMAGEDRTYTLHFNTIVGETLCLQDLTTGEKINIVEGGTYTFEAEPQSTNNQRFLLLAQQGIKSDIDDIDPASIWYNNRTLYITNAADNSTLQLYDVSGHQIFSTTIHHTPYTVDLTHLNEGVYMARVNNQVYKFVCK